MADRKELPGPECVECDQPGEILFTEVARGAAEDRWYCGNCAVGAGILAWESNAEGPKAAVGEGPTPAGSKPEGMAPVPEDPDLEMRCEGCGTGLLMIRQSGRVGCARCYDTFRRHLDPLIERVHGALEHRGVDRGELSQNARRREEMAQLRDQLEKAVAAEEFERAARLRDALRRLESATEVEE